jgi:hypothetical protein
LLTNGVVGYSVALTIQLKTVDESANSAVIVKVKGDCTDGRTVGNLTGYRWLSNVLSIRPEPYFYPRLCV